jgi:N-acetylglutamate synthase-like GNAT family acetyltransferase
MTDIIDSSIDYNEISQKISNLVISNMHKSNNGTYSHEDMKLLLRNKSPEYMEILLKKSFTVCLEDEKNNLIGCGMITSQDDRCFSKSLHLDSKYQGLGYGKLICDTREQFIKDTGITKIFIESLKYPKTIAFHKSRGFKKSIPYKKLNYTILMEKDL